MMKTMISHCRSFFSLRLYSRYRAKKEDIGSWKEGFDTYEDYKESKSNVRIQFCT